MAQTLREAFYRSWAYPPYFQTVRAAQASRRGLALAVQRLQFRLTGQPDLPPSPLIFLVAGSEEVGWFLESGRRGQASIEAALKKNGIALEHFDAVLDFGCGIGRVIRHWHTLRKPAFYGSDYNAELIGWCQAKLPFARFNVNPLVGALPYPDGAFDLVYALSVFTHLTVAQQDFWIGELSRTLKPGGYLLISTHGEACMDSIPVERRGEFQRGEHVLCGGEHAGSNVCTTFHPPAYVRSRLAPGLRVVDFIPVGALGNPPQDYWLLQKPLAG